MTNKSNLRRLHKDVSKDLDAFKKSVAQLTGVKLSDSDASLAWFNQYKNGSSNDDFKRVFGFR